MSDKQEDEYRVTKLGVERMCGAKMMSKVIQFPPRREEQTRSEDRGGVEV
jgi:hypothetical protein